MLFKNLKGNRLELIESILTDTIAASGKSTEKINKALLANALFQGEAFYAEETQIAENGHEISRTVFRLEGTEEVYFLSYPICKTVPTPENYFFEFENIEIEHVCSIGAETGIKPGYFEERRDFIAEVNEESEDDNGLGLVFDNAETNEAPVEEATEESEGDDYVDEPVEEPKADLEKSYMETGKFIMENCLLNDKGMYILKENVSELDIKTDKMVKRAFQEIDGLLVQLNIAKEKIVKSIMELEKDNTKKSTSVKSFDGSLKIQCDMENERVRLYKKGTEGYEHLPVELNSKIVRLD